MKRYIYKRFPVYSYIWRNHDQHFIKSFLGQQIIKASWGRGYAHRLFGQFVRQAGSMGRPQIVCQIIMTWKVIIFFFLYIVQKNVCMLSWYTLNIDSTVSTPRLVYYNTSSYLLILWHSNRAFITHVFKSLSLRSTICWALGTHNCAPMCAAFDPFLEKKLLPVSLYSTVFWCNKKEPGEFRTIHLQNLEIPATELESL